MQLYNSLTREKEELPPPPGPIRMYFCGPTVYQRIHIGNARPYVVSMWLKRWLELNDYEVTLVENVTDINDKIYEAASAQGVPSEELARCATEWYFKDTGDLGLGRPDVEPLASETLPEIIALIEDLVERGLAYESSGDVYFRVAHFPEYGALSGAQVDDMVAQEPSDLKEDPRDFALWKATKPGEDTSWDSPWGAGRPGWHIECSAMAEKHLGPEFEIHGGGLDLRFPHHENEIAQSRGAGREFARLWAHNGMLELSEEKMSKSVGNIISLRETLDRWGRDAILVYFLGGHYRSPIDFSDEATEAACSQAESFATAYRVAASRGSERTWDDFAAALDDDFNTPGALAILHEWRADGQIELLERGLAVFGLDVRERSDEAPSEIRRLAEERQAARVRRDFSEADRLRDEIADRDWEVQDVAEGFRLIPRR
ncbi:MAG: cysteine--tRNA ligase [Actinomycetota bacterium]|nr:cysteine--tRNA ligase [Actinomycetota bacterium]